MQIREPGPRSRQIVEQERRHMAPGLQSFGQYAGLAMARGAGAMLYDEDGNEYIDFIAGIAVGSVGHCHPHYVEALKRQVERLTFGSFTTETRAKFLDLLATITPEGLTRIQMFSGGAEAVEAALRLAKAATGKREVMGFWGGFHGKTGGVLGLLGSDFKHHLGPFVPGQYLSPYADCYRCPLRLRYPECGIACAEYLRDVIRYQTAGEIAAIIVEPIQGTAGNIAPPDGFLRAVQAIAHEHDALLLADEMLTGFGRTGAMWGASHEGVIPEIMTVGKGMGGGFPLSGVISTDDLTARKPWSNPSASSSSYGGNPLASAAGLAALEIIVKEDLVENAERAVEMLARLRALNVQLHMDDFGTGYSSLSYLHRFQIDTLKIDRSFISAMGDRGENSEIVRTIVTLARNLGIDVIAEGVETAEQLAQLSALGCGQVQGFYFSRPVATDAVAALMERAGTAR